MDAQPKTDLEQLAFIGFIPPLKKGSGPRPASSYRAARRNLVKSHRALPHWRNITAAHANNEAKIGERAAMANGAREAAAKAIADEAIRETGLRPQTIGAAAMLQFYREQPRTRPVNRIIRDLERQIRAA
jgi:hypothetical protein